MGANAENRAQDALVNEMLLRLADKVAIGRAWKDSIERPIRQTGFVPLYYIPFMCCVSSERYIALGEETKQQTPSSEDLTRIRRCLVMWAEEVIKAIEAGELPLREPSTWMVLREGDSVAADSLVFWDELNAWASWQHGFVFWDPRDSEPDPTNAQPAQTESPQGRREQQIAHLLQAIQAAGHDPLKIPYGGKNALMRHCCDKQPALFTESSFGHAWKEAKERGLIEVENPGQYRKPLI